MKSKYNLELIDTAIFCPRRTGFVAQRLLKKSRCFLLYRRLLERMGGLRLGSMDIK
jgi:hypothetical protein